MEYPVPLIMQERAMNCWHACTRMLWQFRFGEDRLHPLPKVFERNRGAGTVDTEALQGYGVRQLVGKASPSWENLLRLHGPLMMGGRYGTADRVPGNTKGFGHAVVVRGVRGAVILLNDPAFGRVDCPADWLWDQRMYEPWYLGRLTPIEKGLLEASPNRPQGLGRMSW